jgi:hypothetical protein
MEPHRCLFIAMVVLFLGFHARSEAQVRQLDRDDPESELERLDQQSVRDWKNHPGFFHLGLVGELNFHIVPKSIAGLTNSPTGLGAGGMLVFDYDFTRFWLVGFRTSIGYKRLLLTTSETGASAVNDFPISFAVQKLMRVDRGVTFRYGLGVSFEIMDTPDEVLTDTALMLAADFDFEGVMTGVRGLVYSFQSDANSLGMEFIFGFRF